MALTREQFEALRRPDKIRDGTSGKIWNVYGTNHFDGPRKVLGLETPERDHEDDVLVVSWAGLSDGRWGIVDQHGDAVLELNHQDTEVLKARLVPGPGF